MNAKVNQRMIDEMTEHPKWFADGDANYFPTAYRHDDDRIAGKPAWFSFMKAEDHPEFIDDTKYVYWRNIIEEWGQGDEYHRRWQLESLVDTHQANPDLPDILAFEEMGLKHARRYHVEMDRADFTERCIVRNGRLYAMYMKGAADMQGPWHLRPETIYERMNRDEAREICSWDDAVTLSEAWTKLACDANAVNKMIYGYGEKAGLKRSRVTMADYFEKLTLELPVLYADDEGQREISQAEFDEIKAMRDAGAKWVMEDEEYEWEITPDDDGYCHFEAVGQYDDTDFNWIKGRVWYENEEGNSAHEDFGPAKDAVFSAHPLYWGNEGLTHEFLTAIRTAKDIGELNRCESRLRRRRTRSGKWLAPELNYLTKTQKAQAWLYCNARREELLKDAVNHLTEPVRETVKVIEECKDLDEYDMVRARALSHINGRTFKYAWQEIRFMRPKLLEQAYMRFVLNRKERELYG